MTDNTLPPDPIRAAREEFADPAVRPADITSSAGRCCTRRTIAWLTPGPLSPFDSPVRSKRPISWPHSRPAAVAFKSFGQAAIASVIAVHRRSATSRASTWSS